MPLQPLGSVSTAGLAREQAAREWLGSKSRPRAHLPQGQDVAWDPGGWRFPPLSSCTRSQMLQAQAGGGGERLQLPGSRPRIRTRAAPQAPTSDIYPLPGQLPVVAAVQPCLAWGAGRESGINHCRPCLSEAKTCPPIHPSCTEGWSRHIHKWYCI